MRNEGLQAWFFSNVTSLCTYQSIGTELAIRARRSNYHIDQVPIVTLARRGPSRFGNGLRANFLILKAIFLGCYLAVSLLPKDIK